MSKQITLVISGYYGYDNAGDEAVLYSILNTLKGHNIKPIVLSGNPEKTTKLYGVESVQRMSVSKVFKTLKESDGLISGGGSLLQDKTSTRSIFYYIGVIEMANFLKKPVFCYSQGIGPLSKKWIHPFTRHALNKSKYLSVRDDKSKDLLERIGVKKQIDVVADPVIGLSYDGSSKVTNKLKNFMKMKPITLSVRTLQDDETVIKNIVKLIDNLTDKKQNILLLPFHYEYDLKIAEEIKNKIKSPNMLYLPNEQFEVSDFLYLIKNSSIVVGMRLHSLIFAASQSVPFVGISYDPKVDSFMEIFSRKSSTNTEEWDINAVLKDVDLTLKRNGEERANLEIQLKKMRDQIDCPIEFIVNYYNKNEGEFLLYE